MSEVFRSTLKPAKLPFHIHHNSGIVALGSCFAEHIGKKLQERLFKSMLNPGGVLFHPIAIETILLHAASYIELSDDILTEWKGIHYSWDHHGKVSHENPNVLKANLHVLHQNLNKSVHESDFCLITLGTSFVYELIENNRIVANCHKHPGNYFHKKLLSTEESFASLSRSVDLLLEANPKVQVILTLSPVRHLRDGFVENQLSKALLLTAIHQLCKARPNCFYFPAYEIMLDDLRDYRFYEPDMVHPSQQAIDYIWSLFCQSTMNADTITLNMQIERIRDAAAHKPFHPKSQAHLQFLKQQHDKITELAEQWPELNWGALKASFPFI